MAIWPDELMDKTIYYIHNTIGGGTFLVENGNGELKPLCLRELTGAANRGAYCTHPAGWKTNHAGQGQCRYHRGALPQLLPNPEPLKPRTKYAKGMIKLNNQRRLRSFKTLVDLQNPGFGVHIHELDSIRLYLNHLLDVNSELLAELSQELDTDDGRMTKRFMDLQNSLLGVIDRINKTSVSERQLQQSQVLSQAVMNLIMAEAMALFSEFVQPGRLTEFRQAWRERISLNYPYLAPRDGGDVELGHQLMDGSQSDEAD